MYRKDNILWPEGTPPAASLCGDDTRLSVLAGYGTDGLVDDPELQGIVDLAAKVCGAPLAMVTMVEAERQHFLARTGIEARETPRSTSFCAHAMLGTDPMVVHDAQADPRFADNPLVTGEPHIRFYAGQPLVSSEGAPLGALCVIDIVPRETGLSPLQRETLSVLGKAVMRRVMQKRLGESAIAAIDHADFELRRLIDSMPGIAWTATADGQFDYINARWNEMTGIAPPRTTEEWRAAIHSDDWDASLAKFTDCVSREELFEDEWRMKMADGSYRWVLSRAVPVASPGQRTRWFGTVTDIDASRRLSESRDLIASELSHRIKNIFAVVSGLIALRSRGFPEAKEFAAELNATMRALSTAHDYVRPGAGHSKDTLQGLLTDLLRPYETTGERIVLTGDDIAIGPRAATPLALIFHELATNSAKYGALSQAEGNVTVKIVAPCKGADQVCVQWREVSHHFVDTSAQDTEGFGSRLLRLAVEGQLGGRFDRVFSKDGLDVEIAVPADSIAL